ncbi:hypothetical protein [Hyphomicrobium sp.]|jgi:hypothetical protein|uniref:hypothetical protein n=1 Tax=Hyphomicrobium sp. TaxID=82 RepID=UPI002C22B8B1|nr:hypothetical protein [Hyphomicrobium sp.]HVZ03093.1 hypothetical protein [Hyphomicrobium sp.]
MPKLQSRRAFLRMMGATLLASPITQLNRSYAFTQGGAVRVARTRSSLKKFVQEHAAVRDDPWVVMHGIRALGKDFAIDGEPAVAFLCSHYLQEKVVGGKTFLYMPVADEGHTNVFLAEAILDSGLNIEYKFQANGRQHSVGDLLDGAKALFVFEPTSMTFNPDDLAWSLLAFSYTISPDNDQWITADGKRIRFAEVVEYAMTTLERANARFETEMREGIAPDEPDAIEKFSCAGTHLIYGLGACVRAGYTERSLIQRMKRQHDILVWRLAADMKIAEDYYGQLRGQYPEDVVKNYLLDSKLKFLGHAFETLNVARHHGQFLPTVEQTALIQAGLMRLCDAVDDVKGIDLQDERIDPSLRKLFVGDACHAYHALSLIAESPDQQTAPL